MIQLLIFDLDGTLVDSAGDIITTVNTLLAKRGLPALPDATIRAAIGEGLRALVHKLFPDSGEDAEFRYEIEKEFLAVYNRHFLDTTRPFPGAMEFLANCPQQIAIVSNKHEIFTRKTLCGLEMDRFPWVRVYGGDSLPARKPDPLPLREVMKAAGVGPEQTLMIGDGTPDMLAARNAGVSAVACEYGYTDLATLMNLGAKKSLRGFEELYDVIASSELNRPQCE